MTGVRSGSAMSVKVRNFALFVMTSGASAVLNLVVRALLSAFLIYELAIALAYVCSTTVAFLLARRFVFTSAGVDWRGEYTRFAVVNVLGFVQVLAVSSGLARIMFPAMGYDWHPLLIAHLAGLASLAFTSYFAHLHYSFGRTAAGGAP